MTRVRGYAMLARLSSNAAASVRSATNTLPTGLGRATIAARAGGLRNQQKLGLCAAPFVAGQHSGWFNAHGAQRGFAAAADSQAASVEVSQSEQTFPGSIVARDSVPENQGMEASI